MLSNLFLLDLNESLESYIFDLIQSIKINKFELLIDDMTIALVNHDKCYDPSYAPSLIAMLVAMLMTMLMAILRAIADRSPLEHRLVPKPILFRVSLCSSESYR